MRLKPRELSLVQPKKSRSINGLPLETLNHETPKMGIWFMGPEPGCEIITQVVSGSAWRDRHDRVRLRHSLGNERAVAASAAARKRERKQEC
jgi:hypothetical protein